GILKPGVPAIIGPQPEEAETVIKARAAAIGAPVFRWQREWHCEPRGEGMRYAGTRWRLDLPLPSLPGRHQIANAGAAIAYVAKGWHDRPLDLVVGMLKTKDASGFLAPLAPHARTLYAVTIPGEENPHPASQIVASARSVGITARECGAVDEALRKTVQQPGPARILICGSL